MSEIKIRSIAQLIQALHSETSSEYRNIANRLEIGAEEVEKYCEWDDHYYTRVCLYRSEHVELLLLCWHLDQSTPIHGHNGEECWVHLVSGSLEETIYQLDSDDNPEIISTSLQHQGTTSFMKDEKGLHRLRNIGQTKAISLHLYHAPIAHCQSYDRENKCMRSVDLSYDSDRSADCFHLAAETSVPFETQ